MKPTKRELELALALKLAVKVMVRYSDSSDCWCDCPLYMDCPIVGKYFKRPERKCAKAVTDYYLAAARKKVKGGK